MKMLAETPQSSFPYHWTIFSNAHLTTYAGKIREKNLLGLQRLLEQFLGSQVASGTVLVLKVAF
jgi:hypothetical protein